MSHRRVGLLAVTVLSMIGFSSAASAAGCGCWWWQNAYYAQPALPVVDPYRSPGALAPSPIFVVRQGPYYSGPGLMIPYQTWSPGGYEGAYPYVGPHRHRYGVRYGYRHRAIRYHRHYGPGVYPRRAAVRHAVRYHGPYVPPMSRRGVIRSGDRYYGPVPPRGRVHSEHRGKSDMRGQPPRRNQAPDVR